MSDELSQCRSQKKKLHVRKEAIASHDSAYDVILAASIIQAGGPEKQLIFFPSLIYGNLSSAFCTRS